jgi:hypothetical protein
MNGKKRTAVLLGLLGLVLIVLGVKYMPVIPGIANMQSGAEAMPVIYFFSLDNPCECMVELTQRAEQQMANWPVDQRGGILVERVVMEQRKDLETKYQVFRAPCLVLVNAQDQIAWRQDYPLIEGGPFKLEELEAAIRNLGSK